jgi:hypothetical protein
MEAKHPMTADTLRCQNCQAENRRDAPHCWRCNEHDWREDDDSFAPPYPIRFASVPGILILIGLIALAWVCSARSPAVAIVLIYIAAPAFLISEVQALWSRRWGVPMSSRDRWRTILKCTLVLAPLVLFVTLASLVLYGADRLGASWLFWQETLTK